MPDLVSVIIPACNRWPMLREAVESVLAQSYRDFEIVVVDDGSEDGTAEKLPARYGSAVRVVAQAWRGVAAARNLGVRCSRGAYLAFLDSDDLWQRRKLEIQTGFMRRAPDCRICQTEEVWIRNGVRVNPRIKHRKPSGDIFRRSLELCLVSPSAVLMTRDLFTATGGFDESFLVCEDYDLWLRIAADHPVHLIREPLVIKRGGHADQLSRSTWGLDRFRVRAIKKLLESGLRGEKRRWAIETMARKVEVLAQGARKRLREREALQYQALLTDFIGELDHDRSANPGLLPAQGLSRANATALAQVE
ncbi:MAG TPA: glycosyltransferase family A protein [Candidatus Binatia bacterium]|jgi:glycosyltransferase involved in cell wall biosynthesis